MKSGASALIPVLAGTGRIVGGEKHEAMQQQRELRGWKREATDLAELKSRRAKLHRNGNGSNATTNVTVQRGRHPKPLGQPLPALVDVKPVRIDAP